jgi:ribonuclease BN (tRNA processing enzyme)
VAEGQGRGSRRRGPLIAVGSLRVTVAGSSCSVPRIARACSAYLVEDGGFAFSLDFGTGAFANIRRYVDYDKLGAVVISHMHADHFLDLIPLRYAIRYGSKRRPDRLPVWMPPGGIEMLRSMTNVFANEGNGDFLDEAFALQEFDPAAPLPLGSGRLRFAPTTHFVTSFAIRYERNGTSITYSADTAPDQRVVELARGTDLFLCEATLLAGEEEQGGIRGHLSSKEAGQMAADAGVARLVLTHYPQDATTRDLIDGARSIYKGEVAVADDHDVIDVG